MIDLPDSSHFSSLLADQRFYAVLAVAVLAGLVRGFSGFGSALIFIPLSSAILGPRTATASFLLIDFFCTLPLFVQLYPISNKREVWPLSLAAAVTIPLGAMFLQVVDPVHLRWGIAAIVLFPPPTVALSLLLAGPYVLSLFLGGYFFKGSSETLYRRIAYAIVATAALVSLPIFDGMVR